MVVTICGEPPGTYLEYVMRVGPEGPDGKDGKEAVEERQGGEGERPAPGSSLSRYTWNINSETSV